jgi:hypothetical protein
MPPAKSEFRGFSLIYFLAEEMLANEISPLSTFDKPTDILI